MSERSLIWRDGRLLPAEGPHLDARDRGFTLGDGLFETVRVRRGRPVALDRHLARLFNGLATVQIPPPADRAALAAAVETTLRANGLVEAVVRLTVSRGVAHPRGLLFDPAAPPTVVVQAEPFAGYPDALYERGLRLATSAIRRDEASPLARVKSLSRQDLVLARHEAARAGADEALLRNTAGRLASASAANLFLVVDGGLATPDGGSGALPGVTRGLVLSALAPALGLAAAERPIAAEELGRAEEAFLTSALLGVAPVTWIDGAPVGAGRPGAVAARLARALEEWVASG